MDPPVLIPSSRKPPPEPRRVSFPIPSSRIDPDAAKVVRRLARHGHSAYLVGGCVRDLLLGRNPKDFDIATSARPPEVKSLFRNCRIIGRRFRLAHVLFGGGKILEVATFRRDPSTLTEGHDEWDLAGGADAGDETERPGRGRRDVDEDLLIRHDNVFGTPHEDALRRDFTINALFYDIERQEIVDYVGGLAEIERRVIRTIGEPDIRFREDPVRIFRAIKFAARLDLGLDPDVYDAMVVHRDELLRAARPRVLEEVLRFLREGASRRSFWLAWETGVLAVVLPELSSFLDDDPEYRSLIWQRLRAIDAMIGRGERPTDAVLLSALLLEPVEEAVEGERDVLSAVSDFLTELVMRLATPRRMIDRMRQLLSVQRRLRTGRLGSLPRRDFYADAAALFTIDATARGTPQDVVDAVVAGREPGSRPGRPARARKPSGDGDLPPGPPAAGDDVTRRATGSGSG